MNDLKPGQYFIQKTFVDDRIVVLYGFFERLTDDGRCAGYMHHNNEVSFEGRVLSKAQHEFVAVISKRAFEKAKRLGWPNDEAGVEAVLGYSRDPSGILKILMRVFGKRDSRSTSGLIR